MEGRRRDVIVVGGGPAGATAAALLAAAGRDVLVLERETFPRFHVGESLLPMDLPIFERLGVDLSHGPYLRKAGAEFLDEAAGQAACFGFDEALPGTPGSAWQVERSKFDTLLLGRAAESGAEVRQGQEVTAIDFSADAVRVQTRGGAFDARYCIDATGQNAFLGPFREFGRAAVFRHYDEIAPARAEELAVLGNVKIFLVPDGWMWGIPLHGRKLSVGLVLRRGSVREAALDEAVARSPVLAELTAGATADVAHSVGNFSYRNAESGGARHACIGDAACFLDPVFSSGVTLAMCGAEKLADLLVPALNEGREADPQVAADLLEAMMPAYRVLGALVHRFYHSRMVNNVFFASRRDAHFRQGMMSTLAGDVWRPDNPFAAALMRSRRDVPEGFAPVSSA
jgi:flavin-dependent dehydrogenase